MCFLGSLGRGLYLVEYGREAIDPQNLQLYGSFGGSGGTGFPYVTKSHRIHVGNFYLHCPLNVAIFPLGKYSIHGASGSEGCFGHGSNLCDQSLAKEI